MCGKDMEWPNGQTIREHNVDKSSYTPLKKLTIALHTSTAPDFSYALMQKAANFDRFAQQCQAASYSLNKSSYRMDGWISTVMKPPDYKFAVLVVILDRLILDRALRSLG